MPKRVGYLYDKMVDRDFIRSVIQEAAKGRRNRRDIARVAKAFGRAINSEVLEKVGKLESELQCVRSGMAEEKAVNCRARILRFGDECLHGERHTKDHFDQTLRDIAAYERYCEDHPEFENNVTELTSDRIKTIYRRCLDSNDFLQ